MIQQRVIQAYEAEKARSRLPGYVPTYDDFDEDPGWTPPPQQTSAPAARASAPAETAKFQAQNVQPPEKPRGPHHSPAAPPRGAAPREKRANDGFGAGIFEQNG